MSSFRSAESCLSLRWDSRVDWTRRPISFPTSLGSRGFSIRFGISFKLDSMPFSLILESRIRTHAVDSEILCRPSKSSKGSEHSFTPSTITCSIPRDSACFMSRSTRTRVSRLLGLPTLFLDKSSYFETSSWYTGSEVGQICANSDPKIAEGWSDCSLLNEQ